MALQVKTKLPSFNGVAAGQTATVQIPLGATYHDITLEYRESGTLANQATLEAAIEKVIVKLNGKAVRTLTSEQLIDIYAHYGVAFTDGFLPIYFAEPWARNAASEEGLAWGTNNLQSFSVEVQIASGATSPTLEAVCTKTLDSRPLGAIKKFTPFNVPVAAIGVNNFQTLPRIDSYVALHCHSANIDDVEVQVDNLESYFLTEAQMQQDLGNNPTLSAIAGWFHVQFNPRQRIEDFLRMVQLNDRGQPVRAVQDFRVNFNMGSATSFDLIAETIGTV